MLPCRSTVSPVRPRRTPSPRRRRRTCGTAGRARGTSPRPPSCEIELTIGLPCRQRSPASITSHLELSTITGTREMSGSAATSLQNRSIAATPSIMPSSMLMSMTWAPFSTCWRATSSAAVVVAVADQPAEPCRAGDVGALADIDEQRRLVHVQRLQAGQSHRRCGRARRARRRILGRRDDRRDVFGRGAAAAAEDVDQAAAANSRHDRRPSLRRLVVLTEGVRQAGIGVAADEAVGHPGQFRHVRAHLRRAERAVQPDRQRAGVPDASCRTPRWSGRTGCVRRRR